jgi:intracellular sulfur oxidation DsrE/DsrF family protein
MSGFEVFLDLSHMHDNMNARMLQGMERSDAALIICTPSLKKIASQKTNVAFELSTILSRKQDNSDSFQVLQQGKAIGFLGESAKQCQLQVRALRIMEAHYGPDHAQVAITLVILGNAYGAFGYAAKQRKLLELAIRIKESHCGGHMKALHQAILAMLAVILGMLKSNASFWSGPAH